MNSRSTISRAVALVATAGGVAAFGPAATAQETPEVVKLVASDAMDYDRFGEALALDGDTLVVGAPFHLHGTPGRGAVYVFVRTAGGWIEQAELLSSDTQSNSLGSAIALSGDRVLIGAPTGGPVTYAGAAYVFVRQGAGWSREARLSLPGNTEEDLLGVSVALDGDTALVGAPWDDNASVDSAGSVEVFVRGAAGWTHQATLTASDGAFWGLFGHSLALEGDTAIVGTPSAAYVFERVGTTWSELVKLEPSDVPGLTWFGGSVSLDGDALLVGAFTDDEAGTDAGAAYVFERAGTTWHERAKLLPHEGQELGTFGSSVSLEGDVALIGAGGEDGYAGAAYVFVRVGDTWTQAARMAASDGSAQEFLGGAVALSDGRAVVGARRHEVRGAAYVFEPFPGVAYCAATPNSTGAAARLLLAGSSRVSAGALTLIAGPVPNEPYLFVLGPARVQLPMGDGLRCVGGDLRRASPVGVATGHVAAHPLDLTAAGIGPGVLHFQCWFRDPSAGGAGLNASAGVGLRLVP